LAQPLDGLVDGGFTALGVQRFRVGRPALIPGRRGGFGLGNRAGAEDNDFGQFTALYRIIRRSRLIRH